MLVAQERVDRLRLIETLRAIRIDLGKIIVELSDGEDRVNVLHAADLLWYVQKSLEIQDANGSNS